MTSSMKTCHILAFHVRHPDALCLSPAERDAKGFLSFREKIRWLAMRRSWGNDPQSQGPRDGAKNRKDEWEEDDEVEDGDEATSLLKPGQGKLRMQYTNLMDGVVL